MTDNREIFSYQGVRRLLEAARDSGRVLRLCDVDGGPGLILRHDVDLSMAPALELARLEAEVGVPSSFFFLVSSPHYNVLTKTARAILAELVERGFEVGLHFDPTVVGSADQDALKARIREESEVLSQAAGAEVVSVSLHNPSVTRRFPLFPGLHNAYDPKVFAPERYLSDSRMKFKRGDPWAFVNRGGNELVQLLLHPMHYADHVCEYPELFRRHATALLEELDASFRVNSTYAESIPDGLLRVMLGSDPKPV